MRVESATASTFYIDGVTESLDVVTTVFALGSTCDMLTGCGTDGIPTGSLDGPTNFSLANFFDAGTYLLVVRGPPGSVPGGSTSAKREPRDARAHKRPCGGFVHVQIVVLEEREQRALDGP